MNTSLCQERRPFSYVCGVCLGFSFILDQCCSYLDNLGLLALRISYIEALLMFVLCISRFRELISESQRRCG